jgi:hypothetical protein
MLRITLPTCEEHPVYFLEGRLAGLWTKEFIRVTNQLGPGTTAVFDIENVFYVDSLGEETLLWLNRLGAAFIVENVYGQSLCKRLHLRRMANTQATVSNRPHQKAGKASSKTPPPFSEPRRTPNLHPQSNESQKQ